MHGLCGPSRPPWPPEPAEQGAALTEAVAEASTDAARVRHSARLPAGAALCDRLLFPALAPPAGGARAGEASASEAAVLLGSGLVTGLLSELTGSGGPFVLTPLLFTLRPDLPTRGVVASGLVCSVFISAVSSISYLLGPDDVDAGLALVTAAAVSAGTPIGKRIAGKLPQATLRLGVAGLLMVIGVLAAWRTVAAA